MYLNKVWRVGAWWVHKALNQEDPWFETKEKFQWKKSLFTRYGDMINPWGDLITMARSWCLVKPGKKYLNGTEHLLTTLNASITIVMCL
jgi:hypothetical protein